MIVCYMKTIFPSASQSWKVVSALPIYPYFLSFSFSEHVLALDHMIQWEWFIQFMKILRHSKSFTLLIEIFKIFLFYFISNKSQNHLAEIISNNKKWNISSVPKIIYLQLINVMILLRSDLILLIFSKHVGKLFHFHLRHIHLIYPFHCTLQNHFWLHLILQFFL